MDFTYIFSNILHVIRVWWWAVLPFILYPNAKFLYFWWMTWEVWYPKNKWILIEIKPPAEILKPFKAMEDVISTLWGVYDSPNWRERWCEGVIPVAPYWFSMEIASVGGQVHFYMRILEGWRDTFESAIYSYYPEAEISIAEDYTQNVPQNIPNKEWDMYGEDYTSSKPDFYPIRTFPMFFEENENVPEEKRIDPMNSLMEALSKLQSGEQLWFQIVAAPITGREHPWVKDGETEANKLAKRPGPKKSKSLPDQIIQTLEEIFHAIFTLTPIEPPKKEKEEEGGLIAPELRLTPGEKEVLQGIENKVSKSGFKTWMRAVYVCKVAEPHAMGNSKIARGHFLHFATQNLNSIYFMGPTRSRIHYLLRDRRLYLRKRKQFRHYVERLPAYWPWNLYGEPHPWLRTFHYPMGPGRGKATLIFNAEELATIFHFQSKITISSLPRVEAKRGGPPPELPVE